jgi:hypothetical protein
MRTIERGLGSLSWNGFIVNIPPMSAPTIPPNISFITLEAGQIDRYLESPYQHIVQIRLEFTRIRHRTESHKPEASTPLISFCWYDYLHDISIIIKSIEQAFRPITFRKIRKKERCSGYITIFVKIPCCGYVKVEFVDSSLLSMTASNCVPSLIIIIIHGFDTKGEHKPHIPILS